MAAMFTVALCGYVSIIVISQLIGLAAKKA